LLSRAQVFTQLRERLVIAISITYSITAAPAFIPVKYDMFKIG